ncbi:MAG: carboxy methyl transferase for protein phosphatase 2A [Caeruleum heppii]|nr:MAG: carboxy methyl transferase for protein phosphatase 2A [Caeruleum heppii]
MSAPSIPNLNTLRHPRSFARGRGRGTTSSSDPSSQNKQSSDQIVQQTDQDALLSRLSAVDLGYLQDEYARLFASEAERPRRFPIINRGTYVRTSAIDTLVQSFLQDTSGDPTCTKKQIISLGAGSDTRFFRLRNSIARHALVYHELDFPAVTAQKISSIRRSERLLAAIEAQNKQDTEITFSQDGTSLHSSSYHIHPVDLRTLASPSPLSSSPSASLPGLCPTTPTLLISECCLIYLPPHSADSLLARFTTSLIPSPTPLSLIIYEPINPSDPFGQTMISNLRARGIHLQTLQKYASLGRQKERLKVMGFGAGQRSADVKFLWDRWVDETEKTRVAALEMLDEVEEWELLAGHYCVAWGWRGGGGDEEGEHGRFEGWEDLPAQENDD